MTAAFNLAEVEPWEGLDWGRLVCRAAWDETPDARTFLLAPEKPGRIPFAPGQFMTFRAEIDGVEVQRSYTIASSAAVERSIAITVKRKPGGVFSPWLHRTLEPGGAIDAFGPGGGFGPDRPGEAWLMVSAGSGVTPMASSLRTAADLGFDLDVVHVHCARTLADVIFGAEWPWLPRRLPRLRTEIVPSDGGRGRLDEARLLGLVPDIASRRVLCCGPEAFMADVRAWCLRAGVAEDAFLQESFDFGPGEAPEPASAETEAPAAEAAPTRRVTFAKSGWSFEVAEGRTILAAARLAGAPMPASCSKGMCGTCKTLKLEGEVAMTHQGGIRQREVDRGLILPCCSYALTDVTLDR